VYVRVIVLMGALALAAAAGCRSDDDGTSDEVGALSKSEFAEQANSICASSSGAESIAVDARLIADVDQLVPPESEQDTIDQLLDRWHERTELEDQRQGARQGTEANDDGAQVSGLDSQIDQVDERANQIAREAGLDECVITG